MKKKYFYIPLLLLSLWSNVTPHEKTPFLHLLLGIPDYSHVKAIYDQEFGLMDPIDLKKIKMEIDPKLFETPSGKRLARIDQLTEAFAKHFTVFVERQKNEHMIKVDSHPSYDPDTELGQMWSVPLPASPIRVIPRKEFREFVLNLNKIKQNGYHLDKAIKEGTLVMSENIIVMRNVMRQFETKLEQNTPADDFKVGGTGVNGLVFILDVDEDDLVNLKRKETLKTVSPQINSIQEDNSSRTNDEKPTHTQSKSSQEILVDESMNSTDNVSEQVDFSSSTSVHSSDTNAKITKQTLRSFAIKKTLFYVGAEEVRLEDYEPIYTKNLSLVRELEANILIKKRDPLNLFYVKYYGSLDITHFLKELTPRPNFPQLQHNVIPITEEKATYANVAFSVMNSNPFDLETFLNNLNLKRTMMWYHTFLQMMLNLLNGLIILNFEFYHCDLKPQNIMFRPLENGSDQAFDKEIPWINTVESSQYDLFRINPNDMTQKFDGDSIIAYPMELFPGKHFLMSIIDVGNDMWVINECEESIQKRFYRQCVSASPKYMPSEFNSGIKQIPGFDVFSVSMIFTEMLMTEVGFGNFSKWNSVYTFLRLEPGRWSYYSGTEFKVIHDVFNNLEFSTRSKPKRSDDFETFKSRHLESLKENPMYLHVQQIWDGDNFPLKQDLVAKMEKEIIAMGEFKNFYEVFSIAENRDVKDDLTLRNLKFDSFLHVNRSQFQYIWLVLLRYFWNHLYAQRYTQKVNKMFKIKSGSQEMRTSDSLEKVEVPNVLLSGDSDESVFKPFLNEVLKMKRDLLPLKHHMGFILFRILKEDNSSKRTKLEDLRDMVQGQYYTIVSQGKQTFRVEPKKKDTEIPESPQRQEHVSASVKSSIIADELDFKFNLDYIVNVRRTKQVVAIEDGQVVTIEAKSGNKKFTSESMVGRDSVELSQDDMKLVGEIEQFRNFEEKIECTRNSKEKDGNSGKLGRKDNIKSMSTVNPDELDEPSKII
jgi:serine/threonine protein kinase